MIDEKKKEEAIHEVYNSNAIFRRYEQAEIAFKAGINWFLDNLWHDASEEPKDREKEILYISNINFIGMLCSKYLRMYRKESWKDIVSCFDITRWLYIEDLLKGGK